MTWSRVFKAIGILLLAIVVAGVAGGLWLMTSLPRTNGDHSLAGIEQPVEIVRDAVGAPQIFAKTEADAYFALGVAHAQDRIWQMESMRRYGAGRLAEVIGEAALAGDKWMRTLGLYRLAEQQVADLEPPVRAALEAYARGVNAWLEMDFGLLSVEFAVLNYRPEPWKPADSVVWSKIMATRLAGNWRNEILRARLASRLTPEQVRELWPAYPADAPVTIAGLGVDFDDARLNRIARLPPGPQGLPVGASNAWALAPSQTNTGGAILANDPHLGFSAPIMWYLARIETPTLKTVGATVPGVPFTILGHNRRIAWGLTSTESDLEDLFVEKLAAGNPASYVTPDGDRPFDLRDEVIKVKDAADVTLTVRTTRHGPVISDLAPAMKTAVGAGHVIALAATYLQPNDRSAEAFYGVNRAGDWPAFTEALKRFQGPQQNFFYADVEGAIGFIAPGLVPVRGHGSGYVPTAGWDGGSDWREFIPFDELPRSFKPASGRLINANNRITPPDYRHFLGNDWGPPYRAERIAALLDAGAGHSLDGNATMQRDVTSEMAKALLPLMVDGLGESGGDQSLVVAMLRAWRWEMLPRAPEPLIFNAWLRQLNIDIYADELGELTPAYLGLRPRFIHSVLSRRQQWCDNVTTPETESCGDILTASLQRALSGLRRDYGDSIPRWRWASAHKATFRHPLLSRIPGAAYYSDLQIETGGGHATINRAAMRVSDAEDPFADIHGPGFRAVYDLKNLARSRFMIATGQSGHPLSDNYGNLLSDWKDGRYRRMSANRKVLIDRHGEVMTLRPSGAE